LAAQNTVGQSPLSAQSAGATPVVALSATANTTAQNLSVQGTLVGYSFTPLVPSGGVAPYTYSYTGPLPAGLGLNPSTGVVSIQCLSPGTGCSLQDASAPANVVFTVTDATGVIATTSTVSFSVTGNLNYEVLIGQGAGADFSGIVVDTGITTQTFLNPNHAGGTFTQYMPYGIESGQAFTATIVTQPSFPGIVCYFTDNNFAANYGTTFSGVAQQNQGDASQLWIYCPD
jgi:hypothetical protein